MRLVGIALLAAWLVAWAAAPHGESIRQMSLLGAVAAAGGDEAAIGWLDLPRGAAAGTLHIAIVDAGGRVAARWALPADLEVESFRLAALGGGSFLLAMAERRWAPDGVSAVVDAEPIKRRPYLALRFRRLGPAGTRALPGLSLSGDAGEWRLAASGDEAGVTWEQGGHSQLFVLSEAGEWQEQTIAAAGSGSPRTLIGAAAGHLVTYTSGRPERGGHLDFAPGRAAAWVAELSRPSCFDRPPALAIVPGGPASRPPTVTSVIALRGGYARLTRLGAIGCVDGVRDGQPFLYRDLPLDEMVMARLSVDDRGGLTVRDEQEAQLARRWLRLPEQPGGRVAIDVTPARVLAVADGGSRLRYRIFGGDGPRGVTAVATRVAADGTEIVLERGNDTTLLAPQRHYRPDHRPILRGLAILPLLVLGLGAGLVRRLLLRLRGLRPAAAEAPLPAGRVVVEGELALDADAPVGGLQVRRGGALVWLFLEGAAVLRASDLRPRSQPRGDAVDVAGGARIVASGTIDLAASYRGAASMRARSGDLVVVGCTLAEAQARVTRRFINSLVLLAAAAAAVAAVALR